MYPKVQLRKRLKREILSLILPRFSGVLNEGVDFLTLDFFNGILRNKCFPLDPVLKENLAFLLLGCDYFMSGVFGVPGLFIPF